MATVTTKPMSVDEFFDWANRPENTNRFWELDEGEVVEMPSPGELHGVICALVAHLLWAYVLERRKGYVCSNDTGLVVKRKPATVRGPDVMLFAESKSLRKLSRKFARQVPQLLVEVLSPSDKWSAVNRRVSQYLRRGVPLVWLVDPEARTVTCYQPGKNLKVLRGNEELTGEDVLPKLRYRVAELFAVPGEESE
jgi:Uma2 family endonuclease